MMTKAVLSTLLCFLVFGCGKSGSGNVINPSFHGDVPAAEDVSSVEGKAADLLARTFTQNLDPDGQVANLRPDGSWDDQGDAAIWSWEVVGATPCDDPAGTVLFHRLLDAIGNNGGMVPSHDPLIPNTHISTRDQVSGAMFGMVERWRRCPDDRDVIRTAWMQHVAYVDANEGNLGPDANGFMLTLRWLWGAVGQYFNAGGGGGSKQQFESGIVGTATSVNAAHSACYPIHVTTMNLVTAAKIGKPIGDTTRALFCSAARGMRLAYTEWYCERDKALPWLQSFTPDVWGNSNQRCSGWETPDANGEQTVPTDFLEVFISAKEGQG